MIYIAVSGARTRRELIAYLYAHNKIVNSTLEINGRHAAVIMCPSADAAQYQADRYASGMIGATLHDTEQDARDRLFM
jgi:hypothetical protein